MRPLSPLKYILANIKKVLITIITVAIGVFVVYFYSLISATTEELVDLTGGNFVENHSIVYSKSNVEIPKTIIEDLKSSSNTKLLIPIKPIAGSLKYSLGLGASSFDIENLYSEDIVELMDALDQNIVEGSIPKENSNDILIHLRYAKQNNLKIGSIINEDNSNLNKEYKVSGIMDGENIIAIVNTDSEMKREEAFTRGFIYSTYDNSSKDMSAIKEKLPVDIDVIDYKYMEDNFKEMMIGMNSLSYIMSTFIIIVLCITLGNLNYIIFKNRISEFFIMHAMGYKNATLMTKLWRENLILCLVGYGLGIFMCIMTVSILNLTIFNPVGKPFLLLSKSGFIASFTIPLFVSLFSLIPCLTSKYRDKINIG
ncbi:ABC transporter permease [Clostridium intestinale]|uniref:ABC transporter permease n=1 Tax=Clostridium intestinale TaxID=36845 RepID=UPI0028E21391|nr:ABC transporter permease [Clostridium intestinale]